MYYKDLYPKTFYRTGQVKVDHRTYGGNIYPSDFKLSNRKNNKSLSSIAERICSDWKFDEQCMKNIKNKVRIK